MIKWYDIIWAVVWAQVMYFTFWWPFIGPFVSYSLYELWMMYCRWRAMEVG